MVTTMTAFSSLVLLLALGRVSSSSQQAECPVGFRWVNLRQQCLPNKTRLLPLRSIVVAGGGTTTTTSPDPSSLLDLRSDTYVAASATGTTLLKANLGKKYTVTKVRVDYQNLSGQSVVVSVLDSTGAIVGTGTLTPTTGRQRQGSVTIALLKVVGTGAYGKRVPVGQAFKIKVPKVASGSLVRVSDVSFYGGSNPSDVLPGVTISWGLAVVVDFANARLEDYTQDALAVNNVLDLRTILNQMESHWRYMSQGKHQIEWAIQRIKLDAAFGPNAFDNDWVQFREALTAQLLRKVRIVDYDANSDGVLDHAWFVLASQSIESGGAPEYSFCMPGESGHNGVDMFLDGQGDFAIKDNCIGCFNHEVAHTGAVDLGDLYGEYDNLGGASLMSHPWGANPGGFLAAELLKLGWIDVLRLDSDATNVCLTPIEVKSSSRFPYKAVMIETGDPDEYFMVEYRKRPASGWGSGWWFAADGIVITHILTTGSNGEGPTPYIRIEPADGDLPYGQWPNESDLWDENSADAFDGKVYAGEPLFSVSNFVRPKSGTLCFDVSYY